jgi:hypothetical protein
MDLSTIRFTADDSRLVRAVKSSPRLTALLPAELEALVTAHDTAVATAAAVAKIKKAEPVDFLDLLDKDLRAGKQPDPAALVKQYASAQREAEETKAVVQRLSGLPNHYRQEITRAIQDSAATMYDDLADQLDDVLDRGTALVAKLDGINTADEALDADRGDEWKALKALSAEYADLRDAHLALARAEDTANFSPGSVGVALLFFGAVETAIPNVVDLIARGTDGGLVGFIRDGLPFPVADYRDLAHFLAVIRGRNILQPHIARPAETGDRRAALYAEDTGNPAPVAKAPADWSTAIFGTPYVKPDPRRGR